MFSREIETAVRNVLCYALLWFGSFRLGLGRFDEFWYIYYATIMMMLMVMVVMETMTTTAGDVWNNMRPE